MVLLVNGEQGSAKSTLCRLVRVLIDPNKAPLRCEPRDERDLSIAANNSWVIGLDNMSRVSKRMSNALCRLATGGGFATRELFTDSDEMIFDAKRPIMINGIGDVTNRSDLLDRAVRLTLPTIVESQRRTEKVLWSEFADRQPAILGAFLDAVSAALRNEGKGNLSALPRMADVANWVVAAESGCPWPAGSFIAALDDQRHEADEFVVESSPLAIAVRDYIETHGELAGTATDILQRLSTKTDEKLLKHSDWPQAASGLSARLRKVAPNLRRLGIEVTQGRSAKGSAITIRKIEKAPETSSSPSLPSAVVQETPLEADSGVSSAHGDDGVWTFDDGDDATAVTHATASKDP